MNVVCPYCGNAASFAETSTEIYGRDYGPIYICRPCNAYVGCHKGTHKPLGIPANAETREWRKRAHAAFDPIWKSKQTKRSDAYYALSKALGILFSETHISWFDVDMCKQVVDVCATGLTGKGK